MAEDAPQRPGSRSAEADGERAKVSVAASITIAPLDHVAGDVAGLIGNFLFDLLGVVSASRRVSSKANVMSIELISRVMEHCSKRDQELRVDLRLDGGEVEIAVAPAGDERGEERFAFTASADDPKELLADTVRKRRIDDNEGGLGLMRSTGKNSKKPPSGSGSSGAASIVS